MLRRIGFALCLVTLLIVPPTAQVVTSPEVVHPNQRVTVPDLPPITAADESKAAVGKAALAIVFSSAKVSCDPASHLNVVLDAYAERPLQMLADKLSGASCTENGQSELVAAAFTPNGAILANNLIASLLQGKPFLIEWKHSLYVLYGAVYDQHLRSDGRQDNVIRQLLLIDPRYSDKRRLAIFDRLHDDFAQVEGVAAVEVRSDMKPGK